MEQFARYCATAASVPHPQVAFVQQTQAETVLQPEAAPVQAETFLQPEAAPVQAAPAPTFSSQPGSFNLGFIAKPGSTAAPRSVPRSSASRGRIKAVARPVPPPTPSHGMHPDDVTSLREKPSDWDLSSLDDLFSASIRDHCVHALPDLLAYTPGWSLGAFEIRMRQRENGLRSFTNLLRWQLSSPKVQPSGGSTVFREIIDALDLVDKLVVGFCAAGRDAEFAKGCFAPWVLAWGYFKKQFWEQHAVKLSQQVSQHKFQRLQELVHRNDSHWSRFLA